jgi:hypothetical protein
MKRVEQGVPLEMLDLRMGYAVRPADFRLLSEIVVDVLDPESNDARMRMIFVWHDVGGELFVKDVRWW